MRAQVCRALAVVICAGLMAIASAAIAQTNGQPERFIAAAVNMNSGRSGEVEIAVNR